MLILLHLWFSFKLVKKVEKVKLDNKSLIRCFGVKYRRIFLLVVCILTRPAGSLKYSTTRKNIARYFTPKHLIRYIYRGHLTTIQFYNISIIYTDGKKLQF